MWYGIKQGPTTVHNGLNPVRELGETARDVHLQAIPPQGEGPEQSPVRAAPGDTEFPVSPGLPCKQAEKTPLVGTGPLMTKGAGEPLPQDPSVGPRQSPAQRLTEEWRPRAGSSE